MGAETIRRDGARLAVVVPTFRRPESLVKTLDSLLAQEIGEPFAIVVADNDADAQAGVGAARDWARLHGVEEGVLTLPVAERGISQNRNAGLAAAFGLGGDIVAVAMIDDDSIAEPDWLTRLATTQRSMAVAIICGPTLFSFPDGTPPEVQAFGGFQAPRRPTGPVDTLWGMGNALLTRRLAETLGEVFDPAFGLSGGEDLDLFARTKAAGLPMGWCAEAIVHEPVPIERTQRGWLLHRAWSVGHVMARLARKQGGHGAIPTQVALAVRTILSGAARRLLGTSVGGRLDGSIRMRTGIGRLAGLLQPPSARY